MGLDVISGRHKVNLNEFHRAVQYIRANAEIILHIKHVMHVCIILWIVSDIVTSKWTMILCIII